MKFLKVEFKILCVLALNSIFIEILPFQYPVETPIAKSKEKSVIKRLAMDGNEPFVM